ncbi:helix-turn-helix transcriptional regulator [Alkalihalophilus marmarensis]|uniref:HTH cro/C1-type domain-containing protein n=1 Tax=Alkalihalophilus marmarensis DSM 21297 TaxID=1188261 RepID=U6SRQ1_9BACI|nr:helix-turn-helix transcriptional regulator [Alkalihalophilus marmarensis]ERN54313.1 hypothetical protein A33I_07765 [Alkalihalophilus marmarensis DSM 21297]
MPEYKICFSDDTAVKIKNYVDYYNLRIKLLNIKTEEVTEENIIKGALVKFLKDTEVSLQGTTLNKEVEEFGVLRNNFKSLSKELGIKQIDLAKLTQIDTSTLNLILNNKQQLSLENFLKLWAVFDYPSITEVLFRD